MRLLVSLLLLLALVAPSLGSEVWTVGPPETDSDFLTIQPAIDAANSGDLVIVRRYSSISFDYPAFTITGKSLSVRMVGGHPTSTRGVLVQGLAQGDTVVLDGLRFDTQDASIRVENCAGAVRFENCDVRGYLSPGLEVSSALDVTLEGCVLRGGVDEPGLSLIRSRVAAYSSTIHGGAGLTDQPSTGISVGGVGRPGISVGVRSFLWLGDCQVVGGHGGNAYCNAHGWCDGFEPGDGGPGLVTDPSSKVMRVATSLAGGNGGYGDDNSFGGSGAEETGISQIIPGGQRLLDAPRSLRDAEQGEVRVTGVPGESVELYVASDGWFRLLGWQWGVWFQRTFVGQSPISLGTIPASGVLEGSVSLPPLGGASSATYSLQAICRTSPTRFRTTPVRMITALKASEPSVDSEVTYVDHTAAPGGNGRSWARAFSSLEEALATAPFGADGRAEVWIAEGRYTPAGPGGDPASRFAVPGGAMIRGGFRGDESTPDERILGMHETILDGDLNGDDVPYSFGAGSGRSDNARVVVSINVPSPYIYIGPARIVTLDRLTVRGAEGVHNEVGTGIEIRGEFRAQLYDCDLRENSTRGDGGALLGYSSVQDAALEMSRCRVRFNRADGRAAGVYWSSRETSSVENCAFYGNSAVSFPALVIRAARNGRPPTRIVSSTFAGNSGYGCPVEGIQTHLGSLDVINCILWVGGAVSQGACPNEIECDRVHYSTLELPNPACSLGTNGTQDPMFVNLLGPDGISGTDDDDLRLSPGSPCIDAGNSDALGGSVPLDLGGGPRFVDDPSTPNTGVGGTRVVDHGAFEFQ